MTKGGRIREIMKEERQATVKIIDDWPEHAQTDAYGLFLALQEAVNAYVRDKDKPVPHDLMPRLLRLMAEEHERISERLKKEGLLYKEGTDEN